MQGSRWTGTGSFLLVMALVASPACAQVAADRGMPATVSLPAELAAVLSSYETAWSSRDPSALADLFTEDGYVLRPGQPPAHGRDEILAVYATAGGPLSLRAYAYQADGGVGYIIGAYSSSPERPAVGKFVLALQRGPANRWLIAADIDNGN